MAEINKLPPHDIGAEESVIGSLLIDSSAMAEVSFLEAEDFYRQKHAHIYGAMKAIFDRGDAINQITVAHELDTASLLADIGGPEFLAQTISVVPTSVHIKHYAEIVHRTAIMRRLIDVSFKVAEVGYDNDPDIAQSLKRAEELVFSVRNRQQTDGLVHIKGSIEPYLDTSPTSLLEGGGDRPVATGFSELDKLLGGMQRSDMIVLAARPSAGKSMMAVNILRHAALNGHKVAMFSLEMGREQIAMRLLSADSQVNMQRIRDRLLNDNESHRVINSVGRISDLDIYIDDTPMQNISQMRGKARILQIEHGLDFVVIDYMQLVEASRQRRDSQRVHEVSDISRHIKGMARDLNVPVIAVSQLSRAIEQRQGHRPTLSDLRESGSIEQDADIVMFIHREDYYVSEEEWNRSKYKDRGEYPRGLAELIIAKHRNGPTGSVELAVRDEVGLFFQRQVKEAAPQGVANYA